MSSRRFGFSRRFTGTRRRSNPLYDDVHRGLGGIAGGRFTLGQGDTLTGSSAYVLPTYIEGQESYVMEQVS